jgi:FMN phosphatase YigB (HAD superfamily)
MSLNAISHVFFGVGGVLLTPVPGPAEAVETFLFARRRIRSPDAIRAALRQALPSSPGHSPLSLRWTPADREIAGELFRNLGLDGEAETLSRALCKPEAGHRRWALAPGAVAALELLRRGGIRAGVVSEIGETLKETLDQVGLLPSLNEILPIQESPSERRDAEQLGSILAELQINPESSWFIGTGSEPALVRASRAGLSIILVTPERDPEPSEPPAEWRVSRADEAVHRLLGDRG